MSLLSDYFVASPDQAVRQTPNALVRAPERLNHLAS
jgi:hypothetical protein